MDETCYFCNASFNNLHQHILHESKCGYDRLLENSDFFENEQLLPPSHIMLRIMQYMASQLNHLQVEKNTFPSNSHKKIQEHTIQNPLHILQNTSLPSYSIDQFFDEIIYSYIPYHLDTIFNRGMSEGMNDILLDALSNYDGILPIQTYSLRTTTRYYRYVYCEKTEIYQWVKLPIKELILLFQSLETEIIAYFDDVWRPQNIDYIKANPDSFYYYIGQITSANDGSKKDREKKLRKSIEKVTFIENNVSDFS